MGEPLCRLLGSDSREVMNGSAGEKLPKCNFLPHCSPLFIARKKKVKKCEPSCCDREKSEQYRRLGLQIGDLRRGSVWSAFMKMTLQRGSNEREMSEDAASS